MNRRSNARPCQPLGRGAPMGTSYCRVTLNPNPNPASGTRHCDIPPPPQEPHSPRLRCTALPPKGLIPLPLVHGTVACPPHSAPPPPALAVQVPRGAPRVLDSDYFFFAKLGKRVSDQRETYVGANPIPAPGAARRVKGRAAVAQAVGGTPFQAFQDPNLGSEYRPDVQDCYTAYALNPRRLRPIAGTGANVTNEGYAVTGLRTRAPDEAGVGRRAGGGGGLWLEGTCPSARALQHL